MTQPRRAEEALRAAVDAQARQREVAATTRRGAQPTEEEGIETPGEETPE